MSDHVTSAAATPGPPLLAESARARLGAIGRWCGAVLMAAVAGGVVFLVMVQGSAHRGYTDLDFNHTLGVLIGGAAGEETSHSALGVSGDTAAPTGLLWTGILSLIATALYAAVTARWGRRIPWYLRGLPFGVAVFLAISLIYMPVVDASVDGVDPGLFGVDAGGITPIVFLLSSLGYAVVVARVVALGTERWWWRPRSHDAESALEGFEGGEDLTVGEVVSEETLRTSLELPEERGEDGGVGARR